MDKSTAAIGVFDSGLGGISVLNRLRELLPHENYIYYGDTNHAPYGSKPLEEVRVLTFDAADWLIHQGIKVLVIACNTATSAAIEDLRERYDLPILGIEPALKPAVLEKGQGQILVLATERTLREAKFKHLMESYASEHNILPLPCPGLAELVEAGKGNGPETDAYLEQRFAGLDKNAISAVVLGCTHYPFVGEALKRQLGESIPFFDGAQGVARYVKKILVEQNLENKTSSPGQVAFHFSKVSSTTQRLAQDLLDSLE